MKQGPSTLTADNSSSKRHFGERFHTPMIAWVILTISLLLTAVAFFVSQQLVEQRMRDQFDFRANEISKAIEDRMHIYEQTLWGGVALLYASPKQQVSREQWAAYIAGLRIDEHWPGIQGAGYSVPVMADQIEDHEKRLQAEGFEDYQIKPSGNRDEYSAIIYLEPFDWRNKRALGYDMWSNKMRRDAMSRARDQGKAATSGIITLVQETSENVQRGFLTYLPVYKGHSTPDSVADRRSRFQGWVYAAFRAENLMKGILGSTDSDIIFEIYDGTTQDSDSLLYRSSELASDTKSSSSFTKHIELELQGRPWNIVFSTPLEADQESTSNIPALVAITGLVIDILLFYVIWSLYYVNRRATNIAKEITKELKLTNEKLESEVTARTYELSVSYDKLEEKVEKRTNELQEKLREMEKMNQLTTGRELRVIELKHECNQLALELGRVPPYDTSTEL